MKHFEIIIKGIVQGVGFRPFIYRMANQYQLKGFIINYGAYVLIEVTGKEESILLFIDYIKKNPPQNALINSLSIKELPYENFESFTIKESKETIDSIELLPDLGICESCKKEVLDPTSRFYHYPFTTCCDCGPRYSIINKLPYDRVHTSMTNFEMCEACKKEYNDPTSRRFHSETIGCSECGIKVYLVDRNGSIIQCDDVIAYTRQLIKNGAIVAIKGLGGFHLCCDARNDDAVQRLRDKKNRPHKPFAVMVRSIEYVKKICEVNNYEEKALKSQKAPIVLLRKNKTFDLSPLVAPQVKTCGVFLPYTPLHFLLMQESLEYMIATSGNLKQLPIEYENDLAFEHLKECTDYFLFHDRDIIHPIDDSVIRIINKNEQVLRYARGYVPLALSCESSKQVLALGSNEKNSFAFSKNQKVYLGPYNGDLDDVDTIRLYQTRINHTKSFYQFKPDTIVMDYHPAFQPNREMEIAHQMKVYHHHAHMVSCMAEHRLTEDVIGVIFDGSGYGETCVWGGEFLIGNRQTFKRVGHLEEIKIQGMDAAIKDVHHIVISVLDHFKIDRFDVIRRPKEEVQLISQALHQNLNCFTTSSMGRLFDCVSYLCGLIDSITYDGQGAILLESVIKEDEEGTYPISIQKKEDKWVIHIEELIKAIIDDLDHCVDVSIVSAKFHQTIVKCIIEQTLLIRETFELNTVLLSGGVFQNKFLLEKTIEALESHHFTVYFNQLIPINDNGIAFGQVHIGLCEGEM